MSEKKVQMQTQPIFPVFPRGKLKIRALQVEIPADLFESVEETCRKLGITKKDFVVYGLEKALLEAKTKKS